MNVFSLFNLKILIAFNFGLNCLILGEMSFKLFSVSLKQKEALLNYVSITDSIRTLGKRSNFQLILKLIYMCEGTGMLIAYLNLWCFC